MPKEWNATAITVGRRLKAQTATADLVIVTNFWITLQVMGKKYTLADTMDCSSPFRYRTKIKFYIAVVGERRFTSQDCQHRSRNQCVCK